MLMALLRETPDKPARAPDLAARVAIALIGVYQASLSHVFAFLGVRCRHAPSCSAYAAEAFRRHGAWRGLWLTLSRISRCHPLGSHGWDPPPERLAPAGWRFWRYGDWSWRARPAAAAALKAEEGKAPAEEREDAEGEGR